MTDTATEKAAYERAVSAWTAHLRAGGTTPWSGWVPATGADVALLRPLPDAVHLELIRRLNLAAGPDAVGLEALADRVLVTAAPGRGLLDVPLPWPHAPHRFGTPAIAPEALPADELVRLAVGVLAHLLPGLPGPTAPSVPSRWPAPWRRRFRLHGSPATVAVLRRGLLAQGHVETDWRPTHVVVARPVETMMAECWSEDVRNGGILKWSTTWRRAEAAKRLPGRIDVAAIAQRLGERRHEPVHVVVARDSGTAATLVSDVLGARPLETPGDLEPELCDLLRRLNRLTALTQGPEHVRTVARTLVHVLADEAPSSTTEQHPGPTPAAIVVPPASMPWAREVAATTAARLSDAGYAVRGDLDVLTPVDLGLPGTIDRERTLELAVKACLRTWHVGGTS